MATKGKRATGKTANDQYDAIHNTVVGSLVEWLEGLGETERDEAVGVIEKRLAENKATWAKSKARRGTK